MMKFLKSFVIVILISLAFSSCKNNSDDKKAIAQAKMETVTLHVSGMTCEIGCAKTIQSKLFKKEGIANAKVVFKDSLATVSFDANKISTSQIVSYIDGIAGGELYKASEIKSTK